MAKHKKEYLPEDGEGQTKENENLDPIDAILESKEFKGLHYGSRSGDEITKQDVVTTSSFWFDLTIGGGFRAGSWARFMSEPEGGKAQPKWAKVLNGNEEWVDIGSLKIGDKIFGSDGKLTNVIGVFPQGRKEIFKVIFSDQTFTHCCKEHLWQVKTRLCRRFDCKSTVVPLEEIINNLKLGKERRNNYSIKFCNPINFEKKSLPINPYLLGVLLGDGCFRNASILLSSGDNELIDICSKLLNGQIAKRGKFDYYINDGGKIKKSIKSFGLYGFFSYQKFIPKIYLRSSVGDRIKLLQGLMDTDGFVEAKGSGCRTEFYTTSQHLRDDIKELVLSLGGICREGKERKAFYTYKGRKLRGRLSYRLNISFTNGINPFRIKRKSILFKTKTQKPYKYIK
ncbi:MAG: LAGLIDADG family homing endonuclease, partial [Nanoarchaeota archaeon]